VFHLNSSSKPAGKIEKATLSTNDHQKARTRMSHQADPFSIIGLVGTTLNGILRPKDLIDTIQRAPRSIEKLIQPYVKTSGGITKWGRFAFGFKESDVLQLQRDMAACKQNLMLACCDKRRSVSLFL
jgi:hypothetical protein